MINRLVEENEEKMQPIINDNINPLPVLPESEVEDARIFESLILDEVLIDWAHLLKQFGVKRQRCNGGQEPTIPCYRVSSGALVQ